MPDKPAVPTYLKRGGAIGNFRGFADTWNWMVSCWDRLRAGDNCQIGGVSRGWPVVHCELPPGLGGGGGTVSMARDKWYNRLTVTETQIIVSNVCAFAGDRIVSSGQTFTLSRPASGDAMVYLHVTLSADSGGSISGQVTAEVNPQSVVYDGADFYIPIWRVAADGTIYDATIPGMVKRT